jgi:hypothetical protein
MAVGGTVFAPKIHRTLTMMIMDNGRNCNKDCAETEANVPLTLLMHSYTIQWQDTAARRRKFGLHRRLREYQFLKTKYIPRSYLPMRTCSELQTDPKTFSSVASS